MRPTRKLRRLAQRLRELVRLSCAGHMLDAQQWRALQRRPAVELALSWRPCAFRPDPSPGEAWTCPVPWCRIANRPERFACVSELSGCLGLRDLDRFAYRQHFWRCKLYQLRRSWQAIAAAEAAAQAKWRRVPIALEDSSAQTEWRAGGLVVRHDAWTQASAALRPSADSCDFTEEYGPLRKRASTATAHTV